MAKVSKSDFIAQVAAKSGLSKADTEKAVNASFKTIEEALTRGDDVEFIGFGAFKVTDKPAREGRNPATGATIKIAASKAVSFKVGKGLKEAVNKK